MKIHAKNKKLKEIMPQLIFNRKINIHLIKEEDIKENDMKLLNLLEELKEDLYEKYSIESYELMCLLVTYIFNKEKRAKEINLLKQLKQHENKKEIETLKEEKNKELLDLSISLKNKISIFNEKIRYGDSILNGLISGVKNSLENNSLMTKLLDDEYKLNPYMIFLIVFCVFISTFMFIKFV